jgi:uncharacterized membrane protein YbhN (UPF0104 family)
MSWRAPGGRRWLGVLAVIIALVAAPYLLNQDPERYAPLLGIGVGELAGLFCVTLVSYGVTSFASWHLLHLAGARVAWATNLALTCMANFLNYFGPAQPGLGAKAIYLKMTRKVRYSDFAVATGINAILMILMAGLLGSVIAAWRWGVHGEPLQQVLLLSLGLLLSLLVLPLVWRFLPRLGESERPVLRFVGETLENFGRLWLLRRAIFAAALIVVAQYAISGLAVWLSYGVIGAPLDYSLALLIAALVSVSNIIPVTPNNVGVTELIIGLVSEISGIPFANGLLVGAILRVMHLLVAILSMPVASWWLVRRSTPEQ